MYCTGTIKDLNPNKTVKEGHAYRVRVHVGRTYWTWSRDTFEAGRDLANEIRKGGFCIVSEANVTTHYPASRISRIVCRWVKLKRS